MRSSAPPQTHTCITVVCFFEGVRKYFLTRIVRAAFTRIAKGRRSFPLTGFLSSHVRFCISFLPRSCALHCPRRLAQKQRHTKNRQSQCITHTEIYILTSLYRCTKRYVLRLAITGIDFSLVPFLWLSHQFPKSHKDPSSAQLLAAKHNSAQQASLPFLTSRSLPFFHVQFVFF